MWLLFKSLTIDASKKTGFNCKNNYKTSKSAYFQLVDIITKFILHNQ